MQQRASWLDIQLHILAVLALRALTLKADLSAELTTALVTTPVGNASATGRPVALGWITVHEPLNLLAQVGVAVLLFTVGLKLDLHLRRRLGAVALATRLGQVIPTTVGYFIAIALAMTPWQEPSA